MRRRTFLVASTVLAFPALGIAPAESKLVERIVALETRAGGRLGVFAFDTAADVTIAHRADERFPMCSTFKLVAVGAILARVDRGTEHLDRHIAYTAADLIENAPVTAANVRAGSLSVAELCAAAIEHSDNTAANLLLAALGGPPAVTRFARSVGDEQTRLDRTEPALNSALPGDVRDTTTPRAMATTMRALVYGTALSANRRTLLHRWLRATETGANRLRAGLPHTWQCGDKTGTGSRGSTNDVAAAEPPNRAPIVIAAYFTGSPIPLPAREMVLANVGRIVATSFA